MLGLSHPDTLETSACCGYSAGANVYHTELAAGLRMDRSRCMLPWEVGALKATRHSHHLPFTPPAIHTTCHVVGGRLYLPVHPCCAFSRGTVLVLRAARCSVAPRARLTPRVELTAAPPAQGVVEGSPAGGAVRPSIMKALTQHNPSVCLSDDDLEAL